MDSFQFNIQWFKVISTLKTPEAREKVYRAICETAFFGQPADDNSIHTASTSRGIFQMIEMEIQENRQTSHKKRNAQSQGGKKSAKTRRDKVSDNEQELPFMPDEVTSNQSKLPQVTSTRARSLPLLDDNNYIDVQENVYSEINNNKENTRERKKVWAQVIERNIANLGLEPIKDKLMEWYKYLEGNPDAKGKIQEYSILSLMKMLRDSQLGHKKIESIINEAMANGWITITNEKLQKSTQSYGSSNTNNSNGYPKSRSEQLTDQTASIIASLTECQYEEVQTGMDVTGCSLTDNSG